MQSRLVAAVAALCALTCSAYGSQGAAQDLGCAARSSDVIRDVERAALRVQHLLATVRDTDTSDRAMCVDLHLSQIHSTLRLALDRQQRLADAERRGDRTHVDRERALVRRLADDVRRLEMEARACVDPEPALPSGRTQVTVIIEPWVPELDLTVFPPPS